MIKRRPKTATIILRLPADLKKQIRKYARERGISMMSVLREAVAQHIASTKLDVKLTVDSCPLSA